MEDESEDQASVRRVLNGERHAYDEIVSRYQNRVFSLLLMMTRDHSGAEEVAQDTFLRAYSNLHKYDTHRPLYPWLATIAARLGINWINRVGARQQRMESAFDVSELPASASPPAEDIEAQQTQQSLWKQVASLPQGERSAVLLFYKQELSVTEIASILGVTTGTVKTFLHRGRAHLKARLESNGDTK